MQKKFVIDCIDFNAPNRLLTADAFNSYTPTHNSVSACDSKIVPMDSVQLIVKEGAAIDYVQLYFFFIPSKFPQIYHFFPP